MIADWLFLAYVTLFGVFFGSFLLVVVERGHEGKAWWNGRSECPECHHTLSWKELIPVISFLRQKGKCATCSVKIPYRYPLMEIITGILSFGIFFLYGFSLSTALLWVIGMLLLVSFVSDLWYMELPDEFTIPAIVLSLLYSFAVVHRSLSNVAIAVGFGAIFFLAQYVVTKGKGIGSGDIRLGVLIGALLGWPMALFSIMLAYIVGSIISVGLLATKKLTMKSALPLGVFLIPALILCFVYYDRILEFMNQVLLLNMSIS